MTKLSDVMTPHPITVEPSDTIQQVDQIMHEKDIRQLPVVVGKELVGIITDRDLRLFLGGSVLSTPEERDKAMGTVVSTVMSSKPISLAPDDDLRDAVELLIEEKVGGIPVVEEEEGLVGIVTYVDVLRCFLENLEED